jgi:hypothetical protein
LIAQASFSFEGGRWWDEIEKYPSMGEKWSGAVKLVDLNDFIAPSQACVVNLKGQQQPAEDQQGTGAQVSRCQLVSTALPS